MDDKENRIPEQAEDPTLSGSREESLRKAVEMVTGKAREIVRPDIDTGKMALSFFLRLIPAAAVTAAAAWIPQTEGYRLLIAVCALALTALVCFRRLEVGAVLLYQKYAHVEMRQACLFEPSCSEYMLLAIEKYGAFKGVRKGIGRLMRCRYPSNGGIDYP